ncbi:hypothetical protein C8J56DRAFT_922168, partial [Mycena floridula]
MSEAQLPPELVDLVIQEVSESTPGDITPLLACSLVCKTWAQFTRPHLFALLKVPAIASRESCVDILENPEGTIPLTIIRGLQFSEGINNNIVEAVNDTIGQKIQRVVVTDFRCGRNNLILSPIFDQVTHLHIQRGMDHRIRSQSVLLIPFIASLPSLQSLSLQSISFPYYRPQMSLMILPAKLQDLTLVRVSGFIGRIPGRGQIRLSSLTVASSFGRGSPIDSYNYDYDCFRDLTHLILQASHTCGLSLRGFSRLQFIHFTVLMEDVNDRDNPRKSFLRTLSTASSLELRRISIEFRHTFTLRLDPIFDPLVDILAKPPFHGVELELRSRFLDEEQHDLNHLFSLYCTPGAFLPFKVGTHV